MAALYCTLDGDDLPIQFRYSLPSKTVRRRITRTASAVRIQKASSRVDADRLIPFKVEAATIEEWAYLNSKVDVGVIPFTGYWGDSYTVELYELDNSDVMGQNVNIAGTFQVKAVNSEPTSS